MEKKVQKNISYILQFIDGARFMASSLQNLVNDVSQGFSKNKCKLGHDDKRYQACGIKYKYCNSFLHYIDFKDKLIE